MVLFSIQDLNKLNKIFYNNDNLIFNGEIYNHVELRENIQNYNFSTNTDTEVLFKLSKKENIVNELEGIFSLYI